MPIYAFILFVIGCTFFGAILIQNVTSIFDWKLWLVIAVSLVLPIVGHWIKLTPL